MHNHDIQLEDHAPALTTGSGNMAIKVVGVDGPIAFNAIQNDATDGLEGVSPPVTGSAQNGGTIAVAGVPEARVFDASSTHGHEGVGTGMPNMAAPNESLGLTTRADRYAVFGDFPVPGELIPIDPRPDGPRYAAMGDAVTVNVIEWIGVRLRAAA